MSDLLDYEPKYNVGEYHQIYEVERNKVIIIKILHRKVYIQDDKIFFYYFADMNGDRVGFSEETLETNIANGKKMISIAPN